MSLFTTLLHIAQDVAYDFFAELTIEFLPRYFPKLVLGVINDRFYCSIYMSIWTALAIPQHQRHRAALAWMDGMVVPATPEGVAWLMRMVLGTIWRERGWRFI